MWHGRLALRYRRDADGTTRVHDRHDGPLRVLKSLHPEGPAVCHSVVVHPPGGIVGADVLEIDATLEAGAHALVTTPGATRFYRTLGEPAQQDVRLRLDDDARIEWLPLETLAYSGCIASSSLRFELAPTASLLGWDVLALGLPASDAPFSAGRYTQSIEFPGEWLERGAIDASDRLLLDSPLGWDGQRVLATLWFAAGRALDTPLIEALLDSARSAIDPHSVGERAGATAVTPRVVVLRALAPRVEPAFGLLVEVWRRWRRIVWNLPACAPRVWRT